MPESLTKRRVDEVTLHALIRAAFGADARIAGYRELGDGYFNAAFRIQLDDGRDVVLKASPPPDAALLRYEQDIMRAEAEFFRMAIEAGVPQPRLLHADFDRKVIDGDFLVLSAVDGVTWSSMRADLGADEAAALSRELGSCMARLHTVRNPSGLFGYPAVPELSAPTWPEAFAAMLGALLDDAERYGVALPVPAEDLREVVDAQAGTLAEVTEPVLVHFDLWPGNILITDSGRIAALIDGERMIWGDPLMEFIGAAAFGRADQDGDIQAGYLAAGGRDMSAADDGAGRRMTLYRLYLQLLMLIEMTPRGYTDQGYLDHVNTEAPKRIAAAVAELSHR